MLAQSCNESAATLKQKRQRPEPWQQAWHGGLSASSASFADGTPHLLETGPLDRSHRPAIKMSASPAAEIGWSCDAVCLARREQCQRGMRATRLGGLANGAHKLRSSDLQHLSGLHGAGIAYPDPLAALISQHYRSCLACSSTAGSMQSSRLSKPPPGSAETVWARTTHSALLDDDGLHYASALPCRACLLY